MKKPEGSVSKKIKKAADIIKKGGIVIFPTDTVFGIGCAWDNKKAVAKIYEIKNRPANISFPVLIDNIEQLNKIAEVTALATDLAKRYWPGGLTIILKLKKSSPVIASGARQSVGFRIPDSEIVSELISQSGPVIGTSANFHGKPSVKHFKDLDPKLLKLVDYVFPGECSGGIESTVLDANGKKPIVIRKGAVIPKSLTLKINTIERERVAVEVTDGWSDFKKELVISQQLGSQALMPAILKVLKASKSSVKDLAAIEVNTGPGSFTGTRIGVAVANALGYALNIPVNGKLGKIAIPIYEKSKFD